jgi:hypothetical protein
VDGGEIMINDKNLLSKMKKHFPRWMDIRKRTETSSGGNLLMSIAEEVAEIKDAIEDYKKDFFISSYINKEDDITAFVYKIGVGIIDVNNIVLLRPKVNITLDLKEFYSSKDKALYENGTIYFHEKTIEDEFIDSISDSRIEYELESFRMTEFATRIHVWNIYDEFATFLGLKRYEWETNKELLNRLLNSPKHRTNSTEDGIKNAIMNAIINIDSTVEAKDIDISRPTPENLIKYYKEFGTVIEKLASVNRDVFRTKRWDIDSWNYDFKSIDYVPHAWDVLVKSFQNGIGFEDDLKVELTNSNDTTDATITIYEQSANAIEEYVKDRDMKKQINLNLVKYDNIIKPIVAKYKITASEVKKLTSSSLALRCFNKNSGLKKRFIQEIISSSSDSLKDVKIIDKSYLEKDKTFQLKVLPRDEHGILEIEKLNLITEKEGTSSVIENLLEERNGFSKDSTGRISFTGVKYFASDLNKFSTQTNMQNADNGIQVNNLTQSGQVTLDVSGFGGEYIKIKHSPILSSVPNKLINSIGFYQNSDNNYVSVDDSSEKILEISGTANSFSFEVNEGNYMIVESVDGIETKSEIFYGFKQYKSEAYEIPKKISVKITQIGISKMTISKIQYSHYDFKVELQEGELLSLPSGTFLPNTAKPNLVKVSIKTYTGYSPILEYIHIGQKLTGVEYVTKLIPYSEGTKRKIEIKTSSSISLLEIAADGSVVSTIDNFEPYNIYEADENSDNAHIKLDLSSYSNIKEVKTLVGRIETKDIGSKTEYYLKLKKGDKIHNIEINGDRLIAIKQYSIEELLGISPGEEIYATSSLKGFIVSSGISQRLEQITPNKISGIKADSFEFVNVEGDMVCAFVANTVQNILSVGNSYTGSFQLAYVYPKNSKEYIAFNQKKIVRKEESDIEIVDVFNPFIPKNQMMAYIVESIDASGVSNVAFDEEGKEFANLKKWALGNKKLRVKSEINMTSNINYEIDSKVLKKEFSLGNVVTLDRNYVLSSGEIIDLAQHIITVPNKMELVYKKRPILSDINKAPDFFSVEKITPEDDGFNKLKYSNLDELIYIGTTPWSGDLGQNLGLPESSFEILMEEGILVWNNIPRTYEGEAMPIYIVTTMKIPDYIKISLDELYKTVKYNLDAYKIVESIKVTEKKGEENSNDITANKFDLSTYDVFSSEGKIRSDIRINVFCSKPGFEAELENKNIVFKASNASSVIAIKTGYYYVDGDEYYVFANEMKDTVDKIKNAEFHNVNREEGTMIMNKQSKNFLRNSYMELSNKSEIFSMDFKNEEKVSGISKLNSITACDSFNHWESFGMDLKLAEGKNGLGIKFEPKIKNGYAFIDITNYLSNNTYISLFKKGDVQVLLGKEKKFYGIELETKLGMEFGSSRVVEIYKTFTKNIIEENMFDASFTPDKDYRYYLIVKDAGIIDDIILREVSKTGITTGLHIKNISHLGFDVEEKIQNDYTSRIYLDDNKGNALSGAEINKEGYIINSSLIDWGITEIKTFNEHNTWSRCILQGTNIKNGIISTLSNMPGSIETEAFFIGDIRTIKNLVFKINDVLFDNMSGFSTKILVSDSFNGPYRNASNHSDNIGAIKGNMLLPYVKIKIEMPGNKVINNLSLFIEYKSSEEAAPAEVAYKNGVVTSKVLDTYYNENYRLSNIYIDESSGYKDFEIQIRAAKSNEEDFIWTTWKKVELDQSVKLKEKIDFKGYRFFQTKVLLKNKDAFVRIKHIDLEVVK